MNDEGQARPAAERPADLPRHVVGMDAHSQKLAISIWDWSDLWRPVSVREIRSFGIDALEAVYRGNVPRDSITVIEASTNSAMLKDRLAAIGYRAEVVRSDVVAGRERSRRVCDVQDARSLARAYMKDDVGDFVWTPSPEFAEMREIFFAYRDTVKDMTRIANRIWAICSRHGYRLPRRGRGTKAEKIRAMVADAGVGGFTKEWIEQDVDDYERLLERRDRLEGLMAEKVVESAPMLLAMQMPGINFRTAFLTAAVVEDPRRFPSASKFSAYAGGAPITDTSGEEEERARRKGGTGKPMDGSGRTDMKTFYSEAAQAVLRQCAGSRLGKWGWRKLHEGKPWNKVVSAIARKLMTYVWHILRGDPAPDRMGEDFFRRKMFVFYSEIGRKRMKELGYASRADFAEKMAGRAYGHLPKADKVATPSAA